VLALKIPRFVPAALLVAGAILLFISIGLSFSTWSMSGTVTGLKRRVLAMMQMADNMAIDPQGVTQAGMFGPGDGSDIHVRKPSGGQFRFTLEAVNANETIEVVGDRGSGDLEEASYRAVRRLFRCRRSNAEYPIDPRLIEILSNLAQRTGQKIVLVSGYRSPGFATPTSYHIRGMAADIRIPGMTALMVRDMARAMGVHGIGYYPRSQFVHVDVRDEPFFWTDLGTEDSKPEQEFEGDKIETGNKDGPIEDP
jgi:uncharacterized protein YcbK (DUF882 family)